MILSAHHEGHSAVAGNRSTVTDRWLGATRARKSGGSGLSAGDHAAHLLPRSSGDGRPAGAAPGRNLSVSDTRAQAGLVPDRSGYP